MLSPDPSICLIHPSKRPVGVCHLCLRDRLVRLSISGGESSSSHTFNSSRSSYDSSSSNKQDGDNARSSVGKLGTIFSLMESDNEEQEAVVETDDTAPLPTFNRSKSLSQWSPSLQPQLPRSGSTRDTGIFSRFGDAKEMQGDLPQASMIKNKNGHRLLHSPMLPKSPPSSTPLVNPVSQIPPTSMDAEKQKHHHHHFSWISSLFRLRKRKKKSSHGEGQATETNFFPPEGWSGSGAREDRLWRSRSVSSGRVLKRSSVGDWSQARLVQAPAPLPPPPPPPPRTPPQPVSSLIAIDMKQHTNVLYDTEETPDTHAFVPPATVATLINMDQQQQQQQHPHTVTTHTHQQQIPVRLARSSSTGKWRKKRAWGESPSSVLAANPTAGSEWSFYLTPLRTFRRGSGGNN